MVKKHWPVLFAILVVLFSISISIAASGSTDTGVAILAGVFLFMFLFPLTGAVIGGWYGWRIRSPWKWLLAPAVYLGVFLYLSAEDLISGTGSIDPGVNWSVGSFTGIACLGAEIIASVIVWLIRRNKR